MTTPTPAGSSAATIGMTTPSPLAVLSNTTPRGTSLALSSLQALPETQLVLVLLDHPTIRRKWRSVVVPLMESISKRLNTAYSGSRLTIACVVYRSTTDKSLLRPSWTLSRTMLQPGSKWIASNVQSAEAWLGPERSGLTQESDSGDSLYSLIDGRSAAKPTAHVLEAFVAALELLQPNSNGVHNPLAPKKPPVLARHLLHVCLDSAHVSLDQSSPPFFNADAANDRATAQVTGGRLARLGVSITSCAVKAELSEAHSSSKEALAAIIGLHKCVAEPNKLANEDLAALLSEGVRARIVLEANVVCSGLTPASRGLGGVATAAASVKRGREEEGEAASTPIKRSKSGSVSQSQAPHLPANASSTSSAITAAAPADMPRKVLDPSISTKIMFLKTQTETMIKNWAAAYSEVAKAEASGEVIPNRPPGMTKAYLEQLKGQLMTQQQALKMLVQRIMSGVETAPNFNVSLQSLINIDKEAKDVGVVLGGPGSGGAGARVGRSGSVGQPPVLQQKVGGATTSSDMAVASTAAAAQPPSSPTRPKPFWRGALTWSVSDPVTKQKRDVATLVSATSNSAALDRLMMPWPDKLQITAITQLSPRNLQVYAQSQNAPYILFSTQEPDGGGGPVLTPATAEKNRQMYTNLASSLDAKKSCAFIRHGSNAGAGLVVFATTQAVSSSDKGKGGVKLIGVMLSEAVPFGRLLGQQAGQGQVGGGQQGGRARGTSSAGAGVQSTVQESQQVQQAQPAAVTGVQQPQQQTGMGLGSSMPFNLAALAAAGNVPVSGGGVSASQAQPAAPGGLGNFGNLGNYGLGNFGLLGGQLQPQPQQGQPQGQQQDTLSGGAAQQPNLAALAQLLGIGGQSGAQQQQFGQGVPQQMFAMGAPQQQQAQPQQQLFSNVNPFGGSVQPQQPAGDASQQMDFSKPMSMDQLRALGFIS